MRRVWIAGLVACAAAVPVAARAQDGESGLGLDLSADVDYRPAIAYLGVAIGEAGSTLGGKGAALPGKLDKLLSSTVRKARQFSAVQAQGEARAKLGTEPDKFLRCADPACFEAAASKIGAERLFLGLLYFTGRKPHVRLVAYARGQDRIESQEAPADVAFKALTAARISAAAKAVLARIGAPLGRLKVSTNVADAEISFDGVVLGKGSAEALVRAGKRAVRATAPGYGSQDAAVQVQSGQTKEMALELIKVQAPAPVAAVAPPKPAPKPAPAPVAVVAPPKPAPKPAPAPVAVVPPPKPAPAISFAPPKPAPKPAPAMSFAQKPGLYVALAGVAVAGAGVAFGISAKGIEARAVDANGDGVLDITRAEMLSARTSALFANILVPAGLAITAGGATWMFWPTANVGRGGPGAPGDSQVGVAVAGTF